MPYNWQQSDWPDFHYDSSVVEEDLLRFSDRAGQVTGLLRALPEPAQTETVLQFMVAEAMKTSEIEGEALSRPDVMSSIRHRLGLDADRPIVRDRSADGAAELMVEVRQSWAEPLDEATLFNWHRMLMANNPHVKIGAWRTHSEPMQVISGAVGKEKVHFEAPPSSAVPNAMGRFLTWFNAGQNQPKATPLRAAIAHLYFESIHPFEDGNGRMGRAIAEKALSQGLGRPVVLSLSRTIERQRNLYYEALQKAQRSNGITAWLSYFTTTVLAAQSDAEKQVELTLGLTQLFDRFRDILNERQLHTVRRMSYADPGGFEGGMNARKYVSLNRVSKATATRDLQQLSKLGVFRPVGAGRSARYELNL